MTKIDIAFIGGSGLYKIPEISNVKWLKIKTNFGQPSSEICTGRIGKTKVAFLPRHGKNHNISPTKINYRANIEALKNGLTNLEQHITNMQKYGVPVTVAINQFITDTNDELAVITECCEKLLVKSFNCSHWSDGGAGAEELAKHIVEITKESSKKIKQLYPDEMSLWEKMKTIATEIYGASDIIADQKVSKQFDELQEKYGHYPICVAKTQYSFSTDPKLKGAPSGHTLSIREIRLSSGAEFVVVVCGSIMTMPGLPRNPAADNIKLNNKGEIEGLF